ncbi:MAG: hypothetical protein IKM86_05880 [Acidaminococcaceae bacterium]|nr:hypothetical protein [Acidaminococcaceae bacterium]
MTKNGEVLTAYVTLAKYMQGRCGAMPCQYGCLFFSKNHQTCLAQRLGTWPGLALTDETMEEINANFAKLEANFAKLEREVRHG